MSGRTLILFGGQSSEHKVSVASAQNICPAIPKAQLWFQSLEGEIFEVTPEELRAHEKAFEKAFLPQSPPRYQKLESAVRDLGKGNHRIFLALHGGSGENGEVQSLLEAHNIAFNGSDSRVSHLCFNKKLTKKAFADLGLKVAEDIVIDPTKLSLADQNKLKKAFEDWGSAVLKPVADGSSMGLYISHTASEFERALGELKKAKTPYLMERFIRGTELTVGVIEEPGSQTFALTASQTKLSDQRIFDYAGKYLGHGVEEITPAEVPDEIIEAAKKLALQAHLGVGARGVSRSDMIWAKDAIYLLETNTLPGLTFRSWIPQQLQYKKIAFEKFVHDQLKIAESKAWPKAG